MAATTPFRTTPTLGPDLWQTATQFYWDQIADPDNARDPSYQLGTTVVGNDGAEYVLVKLALRSQPMQVCRSIRPHGKPQRTPQRPYLKPRCGGKRRLLPCPPHPRDHLCITERGGLGRPIPHASHSDWNPKCKTINQW